MARRITSCSLVVLLLCVIIMSGCETTKGVTKALSEGLAKDIKDTSVGISQAISQSDDWIRKNLW